VTRSGTPSTAVRAAITLAVLAGSLVLGGCARPGQLGWQPPPPAPEAPVAPAVAPAVPPAGFALFSSGLVDDDVTMRSRGPAKFAVRTVVLAPGESTGWHRHPGTELSLVRTGEVTVQREGECDPVRHPAGDGTHVPDGEPHVVRNDGAVPAELVVTHLLDPAAPDTEAVPPAC
jgi:quercetin dioxygenase-like cupin family protein